MTKENTELEVEFFGAIKTGDTETVKELLSKKPGLLDAYDYNYFGATPLTCVTFKDDREMIELLIELGADPNRKSDWDMGPWSPLHSAIHSKKDDLASFLIENGATMDVHTAAALGKLDDLRQILKQAPERVTEQGGDGCHPLHFAGSVEAAQVLLDNGANMEARCLDHFSTPVQYLCGPRPDVAQFLVRKGAKPDVFSSIIAGDFDTVKNLVDEDVSVLDQKIDQDTFPPGPDHEVHNIMTFTVGHGSTPLHAAAIGDRPKMIDFLVEAGQDPNVRGGYDNATPMHQAAWQDNLEAAKALVNAGSDINTLSGEIHNNSAAGWAIVAGSADVFCFLMDEGAEIKEYFLADAKAAVAGEFRQFKVVPQENYDQILAKLS